MILNSVQAPHRDDEEHPCAECHRRNLRRSKVAITRTTPSSKPGRKRVSLKGTAVKGTRSLKESKRQLHESMTKQTIYKQKLEKALRDLQQMISAKTNPQIIEIPVRFASNITNHDDRHPLPDVGDDELVSAFCTLSITGDGKSQFHGGTATSEYLLKQRAATAKDYENIGVPPLPPLQIPPELVLYNVMFPCPPPHRPPPDIMWFLPCMPAYDTACKLVGNYFSYYAWAAMPIPYTDIKHIFDSLYPDGAKTSTLQLTDAHGLAVLFMIFVLGTHYDLSLDKSCHSVKAEEFHSLARAALAADPVTEHPTVLGVQTIILMIWYFRVFPGRRSISYQWGLSGFLAKLVQEIGLHRDGSRYIPDPFERGRFEQVFWEFNSADTWQSCAFGRPTSMTNDMIGCKPPSIVDVAPSQDTIYYHWKYSFARLLSRVTEKLMKCDAEGNTAPPCDPADLLRQENVLAQHYTPLGLAWPPSDDAPLPSEELAGKTFQRCLASVLKRSSIMYLHRGYFWSAISQHANGPSTSEYWHSVVAVYDTASGIVADLRVIWLMHRRLVERMAPFWSHAHSAAIILGALVVKSPACQLAEEALRRFDETCAMFSEAKDGVQPTNAHSELLKLQWKAHCEFQKFHNPHPTHDDIHFDIEMPFEMDPSLGPDFRNTHDAWFENLISNRPDTAMAMRSQRILPE